MTSRRGGDSPSFDERNDNFPAEFDALVWMILALGVILAIILIAVFRGQLRNRKAAELQQKEAQKAQAPESTEQQDLGEVAETLTTELQKELQAIPREEEPKAEEEAPVEAAPAAPVAAPPAPVEVKPVPETKVSDALANTRGRFWGRIRDVFTGGAGADLGELEEILYTSDLGPKTVERLLEELEPAAKKGLPEVKSKLREEFTNIFADAGSQEPGASTLAHLDLSQKPAVWLIVGVNGAGKTTSIGKIAAQLASQGKKVLVAAGDTFRAAAGSQLKVWTERADTAGENEGAVEIFHPEGVTDPSAVAFDAVSKAKARNYDVVLIDTAGRLHTQAHLMDELKKVRRVMTKVIESAPHETLIVLDANNGQNALMQAREFNSTVELTGVILTKMDGTAKGGVAVGVSNELKLPIRLIGVGEKVQDLRPFSSREFIDSILGEA